MTENIQATIINTAKLILEKEAGALIDFRNTLDQAENSNAFINAVKTLNECTLNGGKIILTGVGKSGLIAKKISSTLSSTGAPSVFLHPCEAIHGDLGLVGPKDCIFAISYTGNTEEILLIAPTLKQGKIPIIGMGGNKQSKLAGVSDIWINAAVKREACPLNLVPTSSTTLALAIGDAIALTLMSFRKFTPTDFAKNHPGGTLGRRLTLNVSDVMHGGADVGVVGLGSNMKEIVITATEKKLGGILVIDGKKLLGLITDGDVRRAVTQEDRFFALKAKDIMTENPTSITPDLPATNALRIMEDRPSQISVLPVVDENNEWKGLVRLHDLVKIL